MYVPHSHPPSLTDLREGPQVRDLLNPRFAAAWAKVTGHPLRRDGWFMFCPLRPLITRVPHQTRRPRFMAINYLSTFRGTRLRLTRRLPPYSRVYVVETVRGTLDTQSSTGGFDCHPVNCRVVM